MQQIERGLDGECFATHRKAHIGDGFIKQPVPRGIAGDGFFVEQLFELFIQLMRFLFPQIRNPRPVTRKALVTERLVHHPIGNAVEF